MNEADKKLTIEGLAQSKEELINKLKNTFELQKFNVEIAFESGWKQIHPAIDVVDGVAYVGVELPCYHIDDEGKRELHEHHFLIGSDKHKILCLKEALAKENVKLRHSVVRLPNRWSLKSIEAWLNGEVWVDPREVYVAVKTAFETYIEFEDDRVYDFLTLWSIGTYFYHLFNSYPYLNIHGMKQTGKTKLDTLLSLICFNAVFSNNISTASAYRLVQSGRCTLIMDETEKLRNPERQIDFRNMLYAGYKKGAVVYRTHKDTLKPEPFEVYSPKVVTNIRGIEDVLEDRCITIIMKRGKNLEITNREIPMEAEVWQEIRDMLYVFYLSNFNEVSELTEQMNLLERVTSKLKQRELEIWKPILTLAYYFDKHFNGLFETICRFAESKSQEKLVENLTETLDYLLVQTLHVLVKEPDFYRVKDIKEEMVKNMDEPQKWLTCKWVGNALRRLGFTEKRRFGTGYQYYLTPEKVKDLMERLGIPEPTLSNTFTNTLSSQSSTCLSIPEVYEALRNKLTEPFYESKAVNLIAELRKCNPEEAEKLFKVLVDEGKLFRDAYGLWMWGS